ncbi:HAD-IA family hydrolase [Neptunicella marina]|uniref:HAD-IA family hydrolase n=1 Tax=Neptunicella marina TaxID=2125989 RepID=A0A8J6IUQ0_9ALTE|nr:HAD-IA family hydrolase [Neptunicella marina]MBC3766549.1 HAD-IA family hydrolase [Neptunicella marina]
MIFYRRWQPVNAMSFDLDDTLYHNQPIIEKTEAKLVEYLQNKHPECGDTDFQFWQQSKRLAIKADPTLKLDFTLMRRGSLHYGLSQCGIKESRLHHAVEEAFNEFYRLRSDFKVAPHIIHTLETLADKIPLVAITNGNVNVDQIGIGHCFCHRFHGGIKQTLKPHRAMFDLTVNALNLSPEKILHIGDDFTNDVMGATRAGFKTAWYAEGRTMQLQNETINLLPDIQFNHLKDLICLL